MNRSSDNAFGQLASVVAALGVLLTTAGAHAEDIPAPVQGWSDGLAAAYAHYGSAEPAWEPSSDMFPPCPRVGEAIPDAPRSSMTEVHRALWASDPGKVAAGCDALRPGGWRLQMRLEPLDQRIFSPLVLRISEVAPDTTAEATLTGLVERGVWAAKGYQALIPVGRYLVEVNAPCGASGLFPYDLHDALLAAEQAAPTGSAPPKTVAVSACGRQAFQLLTRAEVVEEGQKPREYWGFDFPERRDRARGTAPVP